MKKTPIFWSRKKAKARKTSGPHIIYLYCIRKKSWRKSEEEIILFVWTSLFALSGLFVL